MAPIKRPISSVSDIASESDAVSLDMYGVSDAASEVSQVASRKRSKLSKRSVIREDTPSEADDSQENDDEPDLSSDEEAYEQQATQAIQRRILRDEGNLPPENGILRRVHVFNFMCHKNFEFKLGPLINFICGRNGSGKSAILTALTLCLGGKASSTNRGQSLKSFIKEGEESAVITVDIKNEGDTAYLPEEYGRTISVERHFNKSGTSGFKLKNERGRIISTRKADLDEITDYFALQIDNPMNVLSQDMARQFIGSSSPQDKYKFFIRGIQLEQLDQDYRILEETINNMETSLGQLQDDSKDLETQKENARLRLQRSDQHDTIRDRIRKFYRQMAWAQVEEQERIRDSFQDQLRAADQKVTDAEEQTKTFEEAFDAAHAACAKAGETQEQIEGEINQAEEEKREAKVVHDNAKNDLSDCQGQQRTIRDNLKKATASIADKEKSISDERQRLEDLNGGSHGRRLAELDRLKEEADAASEAHKEHQNERAQIDDDVMAAENELNSKETPIPQKRADIERSEGMLQRMIRDRGTQQNAFHELIPTLIREVQRESTFAAKPVGPVGNHIRLLKPEWTSQLERAFGATLSSFIVTSKRDMDILSRIMKRVGCECQILIGSQQPIDTRSHEPDQSFDTVFRVLEIDSDLVKRQLVIQHGIEQSLLIADLAEGTDVMFPRNGGKQPRNVKRCYCINPNQRRQGFILSPTRSGEPSQEPIKEFQGRSRMKTDNEAQINLQRDAVDGLKLELNKLEQEYRDARAHLERCKQAVVRHKRRDRELQIESQQADDAVDALKEDIEKDSMEEGRLEALEEALKEAQEEKAVNEEQYQEAVNAIDQAKERLTTERTKLVNMDKYLDTLRAKQKKVEADAAKLTRQRATALGEKNSAFSRVDDAKQDCEALRRNREEITEKVARYIEKASAICFRVNIDPGETANSLDKKLEKLTSDLARMQQELGSTREEIAKDAAETQEKYDNALERIQDQERLAQKLKESLVKRRERWVRFRSSISARAKIQFRHLLSERSFRGDVLTDHKKKLLDIQVEPDITKNNSSGRGAKTLSGGEKSFSQICLLLSIWEAMGSPIRCLDEFDVFMDSVNRRMSIDLLMSAARRSAGRQFVLISPGAKEDFSVSPDVNVQELKPAERGQTTLNLNGHG